MNTGSQGLRNVSEEGLKKVGGGISGSVFAYGDEQVLKVYTETFPYDEVSRLYEISRFLDANGIKTAKAYEIVRVGNAYGIIQQYIDGKPLPKLIAEGGISRQDAAMYMGELLVKLHALKEEGDHFPTLDAMFGGLLDRCGDKLTSGEKVRMARSISALPCGRVVLHGDFHENNIIVKGEDWYLIDLDSVCSGSPLFEFLQIFCVYENAIPVEMQEALHLSGEEVKAFLRKLLETYFTGSDPSFIDTCYDCFSRLGEFNRFLAHFLMAGDGDKEREELRVYAKEHFDSVMDEFDRAVKTATRLEERWK